MADAADTLEEADELENAGTVALAAGVADLTRAEDVAKAADRVGHLSDVVAAAGAADVFEGAALLAASEDVTTMSALVGVMSAEDLEEGLNLARIAGEIRAAGEITKRLHLPVVASLLHRRSKKLDQLAVDAILRASGTRALAAALAATGTDLSELSAEEVAEGVVRLAASATLSDERDELAGQAVDLAYTGLSEMDDAEALATAARDAAKIGVVGVAVGSSELQAAADEAAVAESVERSEQR